LNQVNIQLLVHLSSLFDLILILQYGTIYWLTKHVDHIVPFASLLYFK
jgi:hypothetical protein